ncbi:hypothetical protein M0D21_15175 [Aquimarina sp. D1M17]|uniref:hypothetical protein n=1 Tax=Aquimarina acroporae TaxID=2937283 RepID=UPI0020BE6E65|nr:hypothetical protein [Aquimarina acroporae]MCK8522918.1 hypothetical protein [Aquimarina acroporae]
MKKRVLYLIFFSSFFMYPSIPYEIHFETEYQNQNPRDRKLSPEEVKQRGIDLLANEIVENIDQIDLRQTARSSIFETSYGFRWKMVNLHTGMVIIIKVDKDFKLISARNKYNKKIMSP